MKKGFTLIELLAVIVILSIIALISVPIVFNMIEKSKIEAFKDSGYGILKAAELTYAANVINGDKTGITFNINEYIISSEPSGKILDFKGSVPKSGIISVNDLGKTGIALHDGKYCISKGYDQNDIIAEEKSIDDCTFEGQTFPFVSFEAEFKGSGHEQNYSVSATKNGYVTVGFSASNDGDLLNENKGGFDALIINYDREGNVLWFDDFGGTLQERFTDVIMVSDGIIVSGYSYSTNGDLQALNKGDMDAIIVKYDFDGNIIWKKNFGGTLAEEFTSIYKTDTGFIASGRSYSTNGDLSGLNNGNYDAILVNYDINGNIIWKKNFGGSDYDNFRSVSVTNDGFIAVGESNSVNGLLLNKNKGFQDCIIVKYDINGNIIWNKNFGGSNTSESFAEVIVDSSKFIVAGYSASTNGDLTGLNKGAEDGVIAIFNDSGDLVSNKNFGGTSSDLFRGIDYNENHYIAIGNANSNNGDLLGHSLGNSDIMIVKFDKSLNIVNTIVKGTTEADEGCSILVEETNYLAATAIYVGSSYESLIIADSLN